jgi:hypothetical protein
VLELHDCRMAPALEQDDVRAIIQGLFYANASLADISEHLEEIRYLLGEEPDGQEEETDA